MTFFTLKSTTVIAIALIAGYYFVKWVMEYGTKDKTHRTEHKTD